MANGRGVRPKECKACGALASDGYVISFRGLCEPCAIERHTSAAREMHAKRGPAWDKYLRSMRDLIDG